MCKTCGCKDAETLEGEDCGCKHENEAESFGAEVAYAVMWEGKEDDNEGLIYGIEYMDGDEVSDVEWFATKEKRDKELKSYIKEFGMRAESFEAEKFPMPKLVGWEESKEVGGHYGALGRPIITVQHTFIGPRGGKKIEEVTYEANSKYTKTIKRAESFGADSKKCPKCDASNLGKEEMYYCYTCGNDNASEDGCSKCGPDAVGEEEMDYCYNCGEHGHWFNAESFGATSDELDCPSCKATPTERLGEPLCSTCNSCFECCETLCEDESFEAHDPSHIYPSEELTPSHSHSSETFKSSNNNNNTMAAESKFDKLSDKIAKQYRKKGMSAKEAKEIGNKTAYTIGRKKYGKAGMAKKARAGMRAESFEADDDYVIVDRGNYRVRVHKKNLDRFNRSTMHKIHSDKNKEGLMYDEETSRWIPLEAESFGAEGNPNKTTTSINPKFFVGKGDGDDLRGKGKFMKYNDALAKAQEVAEKEGKSRVVDNRGFALWTHDGQGLFQKGKSTTQAKKYYRAEEYSIGSGFRLGFGLGLGMLALSTVTTIVALAASTIDERQVE